MKSGFTVLEIMVVVAVIGILSTSGLFALGNKLKQSRDAQRRTEIKELQIAVEQYFNRENRYPDNLLFNEQPLTSDDGQEIFLTRVHQDPLEKDPYLYVYNATPSGSAVTYDLCAYRLEAIKGSFCLRNLQR